jgi:alanine racemase
MHSGERAFARIDLKAFSGNIAGVKGKLTPGTRLMAVVKANAYGHGAVPCALAALSSGADMLGVAAAKEGVQLREAGITEDILVFGEPFAEERQDMLKYNLIASVFTAAGAEGLSEAAAAAGLEAAAHIKIDTGMNRAGFRKTEFSDILKVFSLPGLNITGIYTHFAEALNPDRSYTDAQFGGFADILAKLESRGVTGLLRHASGSSGIVRSREFDLDMVRPGTIIYGIMTKDELREFDFIRPVMTLGAHIVQVKEIGPGETVGYNRAFTAARPTKIATAAIGYGDGLRRMKNAGEAIVRGIKTPIAGIVCMDAVMLDVTEVPGVKAGDSALFIGSEGGAAITASDLASAAGTISLEVTTSVSGRVERVYS